MEAVYDRMVWLRVTCGVFLWTAMSYVLVEGVLGRSSAPMTSDPLLRKRSSMRKRTDSTSGRHIRDIPTVTAITGQSATLVCPQGNAKPEGVKWEKEGSSLPVNHRQITKSDGVLTIEDVRQSTDGGTYKCSFQDAAKRTKTRVVVLRVLELPSLTPFDFPSDMQVGMRLRVICSILRGDPPLYFSWLREGVPLPPELGLSAQYFRDYSMISSDSVQLKHAGNYTCLVNNEVGTASHSAILKINAPPSWTNEPQNAEVVSGRSVHLSCAATGLPNPSLSWKRATGDTMDSYVPVYNSHKYTLHPNGSLSIQDVGTQEAGQYLCQANNGYGGPLSKVITVTVKEPAKFEVSFKSASYRRGEKATIMCEARGDFPLKVSWKKDGVNLESNQRLRIESTRLENNKLRSELHIKGVVKDDGGVYLCESRNAFGKDEARVKLSVQEVPSPPSNITVVNVTGRSALLTWSEPFNGNSPILGYTVEYKEASNGVQVQNSSSEDTPRTLSVSGLTPATRYNLRVKANNAVGWSDPSEWFAFATDEEAPSSPPGNVTTRATGPNSVKVSWEAPSKELWHGSLLGFTVGYRVSTSEDAPLHKTVEVRHNDEKQETHLTNLKRATSYLVAVRAFNKKGQGPPSEEVAVKTLDDVPPSAPVLEVQEKSSTYITLVWRQRATFGNPVTEYILHVKKNGEQWKQTPISTSEQRYTVQNLVCGTNYKFLMTAHNTVGKSEPSETVTSRTDGAAPISPSAEEQLSVRQREVSLALRTWKPSVCPIQYFTIKIRNKSQWQWKTLDSHLPSNQTHFLVKNLTPGSDYELSVSATSSAGSTENTYEFRTLELAPTPASGSSLGEEKASKSSSIASDVEIIVPVIVSAVVVLVVLTVGCVLCSRDRQCFRAGEGSGGRTPAKHTCEAINMKEIAGLQQECGYSDDGTQRSSSLSTSHYHGGPSGYFTRTDGGPSPYASPYAILPVPQSPADVPLASDHRRIPTLVRKQQVGKIANNYTTAHRQDLRERPYEALMV